MSLNTVSGAAIFRPMLHQDLGSQVYTEQAWAGVCHPAGPHNTPGIATKGSGAGRSLGLPQAFVGLHLFY